MHRLQIISLSMLPILSFKLLKLLELISGTALNDTNINAFQYKMYKDISHNQLTLISLCREGYSEQVRVCSSPLHTENWGSGQTYTSILIFCFNRTVFKIFLNRQQINIPDAIISYRNGTYGDIPIFRDDISKGLHILYKGNTVFLKYSLPFSAEWDGTNFKGKTFAPNVYFELLCPNKFDPNFYQNNTCFSCKASCADTESTHKFSSTSVDLQDMFNAYHEYPELAYSQTLFATKTRFYRKEHTTSFSPTPLSCVLHLVADHLFYKHIGNGNVLKTINALFSVVNNADALFRSTDFDGDEHGDNVGFIVGKVTIFPDVYDQSYNLTQSYLTIDEYLKQFSLYDFSNYCLGVAFTYRDFHGQAGSAFKAYSDDSLAGGICQQRLKHNYDFVSLNTALVTFLNFGKKVKESHAALIVAHEIGHSFGASHDLTAECSPGLNGDHFLMSPTLTSGTSQNSARFSACSIRSMLPVIQKKGFCLLKGYHISQCGNSVPEPGEECDCGTIKICSLIDPCCTPADEKGVDKPCTIRRSKGKLCSPKVNPCCTESCIYISASDHKLCSHLHSCTHHSTCDGLSGNCPFTGHLLDGTLCNNGFQVCSRGICKQAACEYHNLTTCVCFELSDRCKLCCMDPRTSMCKPASSYGIVSGNGEILQEPGEYCFSNSFCDTSWQCQNSLHIVENVDVLGFKTLQELEVYIKRYWLYYTIGVFCLLFTILVVLLPYQLEDNGYIKALRYGKMLAVFDAGEHQTKLYRKTLQDINDYYTLAINRLGEGREPKDYIEAVGRLKVFFPGVQISYLSRVAKLSASEHIAVKILLLQGFRISTFTSSKGYFRKLSE